MLKHDMILSFLQRHNQSLRHLSIRGDGGWDNNVEDSVFEKLVGQFSLLEELTLGVPNRNKLHTVCRLIAEQSSSGMH